MSLYSELKRRNVFRVAIAYLAAAWLITEVSGTLFPLFGYSDTPARVVVILLAIGFPLFLVFSWIYELTPEGLKLESDVRTEKSITPQTGKRIDRLIIVLLALAVGYFAVDKFVLDPVEDSQIADSARHEGRTEALHASFGDNSIAVLPFLNIGGEPDLDYISEGLSEELRNLLARIPEIRVPARTSSNYFKGKDVDIPAIAERLNVAHVLEGSVQKSGNRIRVTTQLVNANSDTHLWSEIYERELEDVFSIQNEIAVSVVEHLKIELLNDPPRARARNPEALSLFLQATHFSMLGTRAGNQKAVEVLQEALAIDPDYSMAWAQLGLAYANQAFDGEVDATEGQTRALSALQKAIEIDPTNAVAWSRLGSNWLAIKGDLAQSAEYFRRALSLEPGNTLVLFNAHLLAQGMGRTELMVRFAEIGLERDPLNPMFYYGLGNAYFLNGQLDESEAILREALLLSPKMSSVNGILSRIQFERRDQSALEQALNYANSEPVESSRLLATSIVQFALGNEEKSDQAMEALIEICGPGEFPLIAIAHASKGDTEKAFEWLQRMEAQGTKNLVWYWSDPAFQVLHEDPRWAQLRINAGISEQDLAAIEFEFDPPGETSSVTPSGPDAG